MEVLRTCRGESARERSEFKRGVTRLSLWGKVADASCDLVNTIGRLYANVAKLSVALRIEWRVIEGVLMPQVFGDFGVGAFQIVEGFWLV